MIKQISTYGALLLTAMVIVRAATIEQGQDPSKLYQRDADLAYIENNLDLREGYIELIPTTNVLLADLGKTNIIAPAPHVFTKTFNNQPIEEEAITEMEIIEFDSPSSEIMLDPTTLVIEESEIGLDRESTINSNLSLLFPRQRINPKPAPGINGSPE